MAETAGDPRHTEGAPRMTGVELLPFSPAHRAHFARLNRAWIEQYFWIEPIDAYVLDNPEEAILSKGGEIWFAAQGDEIVGCFALLKTSPTRYEFTKFAVDAKAQGLGAGKALLAHAVTRAMALGAEDIIIYSHTSLARACDMYRRAGWVEQAMSEADKARYKRSDIMLLKPLARAA